MTINEVSKENAIESRQDFKFDPTKILNKEGEQ